MTGNEWERLVSETLREVAEDVAGRDSEMEYMVKRLSRRVAKDVLVRVLDDLVNELSKELGDSIIKALRDSRVPTEAP